MTDLADIIGICPPPPDSVPVDWDAAESTLGVELPADYKQLATMYGPGSFCEYLRIYHPHSSTEWGDLVGPMPTTLRRQLQKDRDTGTFPLPYAPENLLACGVTDNGEHLFWVTRPADDPDRWRIAVNEARGSRWYTFEGGLVAFLAASFSGRITVPLFPGGLLDHAVAFFPDTANQPTVPTPTDADSSTAWAVDSHVIRAWARASGYDVPDRGRIPAPITEAWEQANTRSGRPPAPWPPTTTTGSPPN